MTATGKSDRPSFLVVLVAIALAGCSGERSRSSDVIVEHWGEIGAAHRLKADLNDARVLVPDRPHSKEEVRDDWKGFSSTIERTRAFTVTTNSDRLRGGPVGPKQAGVIRLIALGDSVTHGWGVDEAEAYPTRLQVHLAQAGVQAEVLNAGVPASRPEGMLAWCEAKAAALQPDWILWTRRPGFNDPRPHNLYVDAVRRCARSSGARVMVVLPPISTFDLHGGRVWQQEHQALAPALLSSQVPVLELTPTFRSSQRGRGEVLRLRDGELVVTDQETGGEWLSAPAAGERLPQAVFDLFEAQPTVVEALFFDEGHPDAEGYDLMAYTVSRALLPRLQTGDATGR